MYNLTNKQHNYIRHRLLTTVGDGWGKVTVEWRRQLLCCLFQKVNKVVSCSNLKRVVYLSQRGTELSLCVGILTSSQRDWGRKLDLESEGTRSPLILLPTKSILSPRLSSLSLFRILPPHSFSCGSKQSVGCLWERRELRHRRELLQLVTRVFVVVTGHFGLVVRVIFCVMFNVSWIVRCLLLHAASTWWGFTSTSDKQHLAAFMKRSKRQGFCSSDTADIDDLIESADDALFKQIIANPNHVSAYLLPDRPHVRYHFRPRRHYRQLIPKLSKLYGSNFIVCMLYKQSYWHFCYFDIVFDAFCHHLINEYGWMDDIPVHQFLRFRKIISHCFTDNLWTSTNCSRRYNKLLVILNAANEWPMHV